MLCHVVHVGGVEQSLGRDAANIEAGSTQCTTLLDARSLCVGKGKGKGESNITSMCESHSLVEVGRASQHLEAKLTSLDGSHIATGATSNHNNIIV